MTRLGWMLAQAVVFGGLLYSLRSGNPDIASANKENAAALGLAAILTLLIFGVLNLIHNWLLRRRAGRVARRVDLTEEPDHGGYRLGRSGPMSEETTEVIEIPSREQPRKLLRPPP